MATGRGINAVDLVTYEADDTDEHFADFDIRGLDRVLVKFVNDSDQSVTYDVSLTTFEDGPNASPSFDAAVSGDSGTVVAGGRDYYALARNEPWDYMRVKSRPAGSGSGEFQVVKAHDETR